MRPSAWRAAQIPNASQAQFAYHHRLVRLDSVGGGDCRERIRHPDLRRRRVQHERVLLVQSPPARQNLLGRQAFCICNLARRRRSSQLDEEAVRQGPQPEIPLVHARPAFQTTVEEVFQDRGAFFRALPDQQVARPGNDPDRCPEPARVLEAVLERHHPVARAPENERRTGDAVEEEARIVTHESRRGRAYIGRVVPPFEESEDSLCGQVPRQARPPVAERERTERRSRCDVMPEPRSMARRLQQACERQERLGPAGGGRDAGRLDQCEGRDPRGVGRREPERDDAAHRVANESSGLGSLPLQDLADAVCVGSEVPVPADRARAAVTREVGDDDPPRARQQRRQARPVRRRAPKPVHEDYGRPDAGREVPQASAPELRKERAKAFEERCLRHHRHVFFRS